MNKNVTNHKLPYFVWFMGAFFFFVDYIIRVSPSVLTPTLMQNFNVNAFAIGGFSAFFYYAYIGMQIPVGILVDRFGPKWLLIFSTILCALSTFMFAEMVSISMGFVCRFLMGFGAAFAFVGTLKLISIWFEAERFAFLAGLTQAMGMVGAMVGQGPMAMIYQSIGWHRAMYGLGIVLLLLSFFMFLFIKDKNNPLAHEHQEKHTKVNIWKAIQIIFTNPQSWLNCLFVGLLYSPTASFGEQWGASFLSLNQGISIEVAGHEIGMMFIGLAIGCPVLGFISDRIKSRLLIMRSSTVVCFVMFTLIVYGNLLPGHEYLNPTVYTVLLFIYGFANSGIVSSYALASEINPRRLTGIALGVANMASVIVGASMIPIVGFILDMLWNGSIVNNMYIYDVSEYQIAFAALPIGLIVAFVITYFQKETFCRPIPISTTLLVNDVV
ncbi:MAG: MFS transporter [Legionella sp.]|jgi:MFS family permease